MTNKMQGYLSLLLVVAMMFVVVFGVARIDNTTEQAPAATDKGTGTETATDADINADTNTPTGSGTTGETTEVAEESDGLGGADGVYEGQSAGYGGPIVARVTIRSGAIENIEVTGDSETEGLGSVAVEKLPGKMLEEKTIQVDGVSGATISSNAIKKAVKAALANAGLNTDTAAFQ